MGAHSLKSAVFCIGIIYNNEYEVYKMFEMHARRLLEVVNHYSKIAVIVLSYFFTQFH